MSQTANSPRTRLATRLAFFAAGFATACWAPLVPYAKQNVGVEDAALGMLLLCLGVGSIIAMPLTGWLSAQIGSRPMINLGGFGVAAALPLLTLAGSPFALAAALFAFGALLGTIDVAMNVHAVEVEGASDKPLMSGFHAMYSVGGFAGAGGMTLLLSLGLSPLESAFCGSLVTCGTMMMASPRLHATRGTEPVPFVVPRGIVLLIAALTAIIFLVEGAILDWSALLLVARGIADSAQGGLGYMLFAIAMTVGRLSGDRIVATFGNERVLLVGGLVTIAGLSVLLSVPPGHAAFAGFVLIGLGASNIVPVLFSIAGRQTVMPASLAIAAVTTTGYAGILLGPAAIGFASHLSDLPKAFWLLAGLTAAIPVLARRVSRG